MASRIKGITIQLNGDTTNLEKSLQKVNNNIRTTQSQLRDVEKLLKLDPTNTELLAQKQKLLTEQLTHTKDKLNQLQEAAKAANEALAKGDISQAQYDAIQREIVQTESDLKSLEGQLDETNSSWGDWGASAEKAGKVAKAAAKACAAAVIAAGAAIVSIVKQATEAYAEYEQLVGGVETLFKSSADTVMEYALSAYQTAGLSANEYMETVTSFSASLLQSLGGNTEEAAKIADMAITDMSDNANKMGTDMASIQNAYQGFAKQNYTMLDNLKLGYGGTKSEMERLLADATALSGVEYDISNLNDIYSAIHVVQTELGITGTTAKEASTTIQGSVNTMKASYQNFLVALTSKNADLKTSITNLIESVKVVISNLLPVMQTALTGIVTAISELAPEIIAMLPVLIEEILPPLLEAVLNIATAVAEVAPELIFTLVNTLLEHLPEILNCAVQIMITLLTGLADMIPQLIPVMITAVGQIQTTILQNLPLIITAAVKIILALIQGMIDNLPAIMSAVGKIITQMAKGFDPKKALTWGKDLIGGLVKGIKSMLGSVGNAAKEVATKIWDFLHFSRPEMGPLRDYETFMPDMIDGMVTSLKKSEYKLTNEMQNLSMGMTISPNAGINGSLNNITSLLSQGNVIVLDTGELVGATAKSYNAELGKIARLEAIR